MALTLPAPVVRSAEQTAIRSAVQALAARDVLMVLARPGTGKTFTLVDCVQALPKSSRVLVLTFGTKAAAEVRGKLAGFGNVLVKTFHALAKGMAETHYPSASREVDPRKAWTHAKALIQNVGAHYVVASAVSLAMDLGFGLPGGPTPDGQTFAALTKHYPLRVGKGLKLDKFGEYCVRVWNACLADTDTFDYADYGYIVARDGFPPGTPQYDHVFIDEGQDTNEIQYRLLDLLWATGARMTFFGDDKQAIYGFRGACASAIEAIQRRYNAQTLPLTLTRRCPKLVVAEARRLVPDYRAPDNAPDGLLERLPVSALVPTLEAIASAGPAALQQTAVLARNNATILSGALSALRKGLRVRVSADVFPSRDVLVRIYTGAFKHHAIQDGAQAFEDARNEAQTIFVDKPFALQQELDRIDTAQVFWEHALSENPGASADLNALLAAVAAQQARLMAQSASAGAVTFSTIHGAKGLEWDIVLFLAPEKIPARSAIKAGGWNLDQERNLFLVAITRARRELIYLTALTDPMGTLIRRTQPGR